LELPPSTSDPKEISNSLLRASTSARRLGFIHIFGFVMVVLGLASGEYKEIPTWGVVLIFAWGGFLIWAAFRGARWYKDKATGARPSTREETK
jgi:hypothetical protein